MKKIYQVDAFTDQLFKGNPAGVMILEEMPDENWMQQVAFEMNLPETAFVFFNGNKYDIRFFTPTKEVPICGHATLASAHILYEAQQVNFNDSIVFQAKFTEIKVNKINDWISFHFPTYPLKPISIHSEFMETIGFEPIEMYESDFDWVIALANSVEEIQNAKPNINKMLQNGLGHLMITAKSNIDGFDFVSRCFGPKLGINEDPATGSSLCALAPLWSQKLHKNEFIVKQLSERTGILKVKLNENTIEIQGQAVTFLEGVLK